MSKHANIAQRLRALRHRRDITAADAAAAVGISRSYLSGLETGHAAPGRDTLAALAVFYGVTIDDLIGGPRPDGAAPAYQMLDDATEIDLITLWRLLSDDEKQILLRVARSLVIPATKIA